MSESELLSLAYRLYPKNIWDDDPAYENTEQFEFLMKTISENKSEENWTKLINKLRRSYCNNFIVDDLSMVIPRDRCFKGALRKVFIDHGRQVTFFVSHVIQCYTIYFSNAHPELNFKKETFPKDLDHITFTCDEELKEVNIILKNEIEAHFNGFEEFPTHLLGVEEKDADVLRLIQKSFVHFAIFAKVKFGQRKEAGLTSWL